MKKIFCCLCTLLIMCIVLTGCSTPQDHKVSGEDFELEVWQAFWEGASKTFGVEYSEYKFAHTSYSWIDDFTTTDGYTAHYYLIQTAFETKNAFGQTVLHPVTARCYYVPEYSNTVYTTYMTLDGETVLFDEEKESWLMGMGKAPTTTIQHSCTYSDWEYYSQDQHQRYCTSCYETENANHTWDSGRISKQATCAAEGEKEYTCAACGGTKSEAITKLAHNFTEKNESNKYLKSRATYTTGAVYYYSCACGEVGAETFSLNNRIEWITTDMLQSDFNLSAGWIGGVTDGELRLWTYMTGIGEQGNSYLIYNQMRNGMGDSIYNGSYNDVTIRFYIIKHPNQYAFNYDDLVAAGII